MLQTLLHFCAVPTNTCTSLYIYSAHSIPGHEPQRCSNYVTSIITKHKPNNISAPAGTKLPSHSALYGRNKSRSPARQAPKVLRKKSANVAVGLSWRITAYSFFLSFLVWMEWLCGGRRDCSEGGERRRVYPSCLVFGRYQESTKKPGVQYNRIIGLIPYVYGYGVICLAM